MKNLKVEKEKQEILSSQNQQLELLVKERTNALSRSLDELKSAQSQLIQSEKMASSVSLQQALPMRYKTH